MQAVRLVETANLTREEWLQARRRGIGSSDVPAILGFSKWQSPFGVWLDKTGAVTLEAEEQSEAAYWGTTLEEVVAKEFTARTGLRVERRKAILQHPQYPWMLANIDRLIRGKQHGEGVLECKTTSVFLKEDWVDGKVPFAAMLQLQHQLAVTGYHWGALAVLIGGQQFHKVDYVKRDEEIIETLIRREAEFWQLVETGTPPPMDGSEASSELLGRMYPKGDPDARTLLPLEAELLIRQRNEAAAAMKEAEGRKAEAENRLKALMGKAEIGLIAGEERIAWVTFQQARIDTERLKKERPDIYTAYAPVKTQRRFTVKGV